MVRLSKINKEFAQNAGKINYEAITLAIQIRQNQLWHDHTMINVHFKEIYFTVFNAVQN